MDIVAHIKSKGLLSYEKPILVAVSGGPDSVVLLDAVYRGGFNAVVAHCNFNLRGSDSDNDAWFVARLAEQYHYPLCTVDFDTTDVARSRGISIEMAARDLRYEWFELMADKYNCGQIAVAHNANDVVETFFLNLIRGAGIRGLSGMAEKRGRVVRPMLDVSRNDIMSYINSHNLEYHIDKTNGDTIYRRNKIRHDLIPLIEEINPSFLATMSSNIAYLRSAAKIVDNYADSMSSEMMTKTAEAVSIDMERVLNAVGFEHLIYQWLVEYDFSSSQVAQILHTAECKQSSGKQFLSETHTAVFNRQLLEIYPRSKFCAVADKVFTFDWHKGKINEPIALIFEIIKPTDMVLDGNRSIAYFDADMLPDCLTLRHWQSGDRIMPFGMSGKKKVSDILTANHLSVVQKQNVWLLLATDTPMWLVGQRADNRFRVTDKTEKVFKITML